VTSLRTSAWEASSISTTFNFYKVDVQLAFRALLS